MEICMKPRQDSDPIVVSVCVLTYNHADFIEQALSSVFAQQAPFRIEVIIGDDGSVDGTREIIDTYAARFPDMARVFHRDRGNVIFIKGRPRGNILLY